MNRDRILIKPKRAKLNSYNLDGPIEQANHVEESGSYLLGNDYRTVVEVWPSLSFNVPIFNCADYVALVESAQHDFDLVVGLGLGISHQEIDSTPHRLTMFATDDF